MKGESNTNTNTNESNTNTNKSKSYERCMINHMKPKFATYFLYIQQGPASGFHTLISLLNSWKDLQFLIF